MVLLRRDDERTQRRDFGECRVWRLNGGIGNHGQDIAL